MKKLTIELSDDAYQKLREAVDEYADAMDEELTVREWLQEELNNNTAAIVEMLLSDY